MESRNVGDVGVFPEIAGIGLFRILQGQRELYAWRPEANAAIARCKSFSFKT